MSIHRIFFRFFSAFCGGKVLNGNVKHFVFDLTCDVTGDNEVKIFNFSWTMIDGGATREGGPPAEDRVGLGPAGRGLIYHELRTQDKDKTFTFRDFAPYV